jgi:hypothetical protein
MAGLIRHSDLNDIDLPALQEQVIIGAAKCCLKPACVWS